MALLKINDLITGGSSPSCWESPSYLIVIAHGTKVWSIQLAQCWLRGVPFPMMKYKYIFQIKYTEAILSNCTRKLLRFEITRMLIAVKKQIYCLLFMINFRHPLVPYSKRQTQTPVLADPVKSKWLVARLCSGNFDSATPRCAVFHQLTVAVDNNHSRKGGGQLT